MLSIQKCVIVFFLLNIVVCQAMEKRSSVPRTASQELLDGGGGIDPAMVAGLSRPLLGGRGGRGPRVQRVSTPTVPIHALARRGDLRATGAGSAASLPDGEEQAALELCESCYGDDCRLSAEEVSRHLQALYERRFARERTILHVAVERYTPLRASQLIEAVMLFIDQRVGAEAAVRFINVQDQHGKALLHYVVQRQRSMMHPFVQRLMSLGADRLRADRAGHLPACYAQEFLPDDHERCQIDEKRCFFVRWICERWKGFEACLAGMLDESSHGAVE